jgi:uncharacterized protein with HEPN domain
MTDAAAKATGFTAGRTREDLDQDELPRLALTKLAQITGEAARHVSPGTQAATPQVAWSAAARMRDRLIHRYFDINLDALWATVTHDLPSLLGALHTQAISEPEAPAEA